MKIYISLRDLHPRRWMAPGPLYDAPLHPTALEDVSRFWIRGWCDTKPDGSLNYKCNPCRQWFSKLSPNSVTFPDYPSLLHARFFWQQTQTYRNGIFWPVNYGLGGTSGILPTTNFFGIEFQGFTTPGVKVDLWMTYTRITKTGTSHVPISDPIEIMRTTLTTSGYHPGPPAGDGAYVPQEMDPDFIGYTMADYPDGQVLTRALTHPPDHRPYPDGLNQQVFDYILPLPGGGSPEATFEIRNGLQHQWWMEGWSWWSPTGYTNDDGVWFDLYMDDPHDTNWTNTNMLQTGINHIYISSRGEHINDPL